MGDSLLPFPVRTYRDVSAEETVAIFATDDYDLKGDKDTFQEWVDGAVGMVETGGKHVVVVRHAGTKHWAQNKISWMQVDLRNQDGSAAEKRGL